MARNQEAAKPSDPIDLGPPTNNPPPLPRLVDPSRPCKEFQYAAKLVSGIPGAKVTDPGHDIVAPGRYYTAVNVHNPATCKTVTFRWKVAEATPLAPGKITGFQSLTLRPDEAIEIDSPQAARALGYGLTRFVKGFVVIESPCPLDVVAVYSIGAPPAGTTPGNVVAFHTERVPERRIEACRDLKLDLSTGVADWNLIAGPSVSTPRPASVINPPAAGWSTQPGAHWIGAHDSNLPVAPGSYTFQTCFTLCSGFDHVMFPMSVLVDNSATIWLNGRHIGNAAGFGTPTHFTNPPPGILQPGLNCLSFVVTNLSAHGHPTPMGLNVVASLTAERGACPDCGNCCSDCGAKKVYPEPNP